MEWFRLVVESTPSGMIMTDSSGVIVFVNQQTEKLFGYSRTDLIGKTIECLVPERFRHSHPAHRNRYERDSNTQTYMGKSRTLAGRRKDSSEFPVEVGLNPMVIEEEKFVLASIVDLT